MSCRGVGFFATRSELEPGLLRIERDQALKFVPYLDPGAVPPDYASLLREVPDSAISDGVDARVLERTLSRELTQGFETVKGWRVGRGATECLDTGWRLVTISVRSPSGYDLKRS